MTRRERLERKLEKRREWAEGRRRKSESRLDNASVLAGQMPLGQPILVGHHSEKRHRAHIRKIDTNMSKGIEHQDMAATHESKADGIEHQLERSIFTDDGDATERLRERIADNEAKRDYMKRVNAAWRKAKKPEPDDTEGWERVAELLGVEPVALKAERLDMARGWANAPYPPYSMTNLGARIRTDKKRIEEVGRRAELEARVEEAGGLLVERFDEHNWCRVTFEERPDREVLDALKGAGFGWGSGSWSGYLDRLPDVVVELERSESG